MSVKRIMRLRFVGVTDFRKSEQTMFDEMLKQHPLRLKETDVVMFRSGKGDQVMFVHRRMSLPAKGHQPREVMASEKLRISWGSWSGIMIADYANMVGIQLENLPTLEQFYKQLKAKIK